ncbi:TenA family protein [Paraburkholderia sp. SARCC-3016]|jgi:thiaminase/transcriptional activator TenA|uniref:TenA family protein n=1 Tax=Paraburkholderia sp. SARCC-3016 TaxID=3058611 RepID=UPI002806E980|nr:TenA family protein [Paraburkholderia sp. SARCC-3016]MDQ7976882.1 TenA family protein [Paraburkholderia sp. SARCC-3016]
MATHHSQNSHSERLLASATDEWQAMQEHRFVVDIERDRLAADAFARYLSYEGRFVETAMAIFGYALVKADTVAHKHWLIGVLHALSTEQVPYFERTLAALDLPRSYDDVPLPTAVSAFDSGMLDIARNGTYEEVIVSMLAAEWMYGTWCTRASHASISNPYVRDWVALHAEPTFLAQVQWLKAQVDGWSAQRFDFERSSAIFRKVLALEIDFHSAAYEA